MKKCLPWLTFSAHCKASSTEATKTIAITPVDAPEECSPKLKPVVVSVDCAASSVSARNKSLWHPERYTIGVSSILLSSLVSSSRAVTASMLSCVAKGLITGELHLPLLFRACSRRICGRQQFLSLPSGLLPSDPRGRPTGGPAISSRDDLPLLLSPAASLTRRAWTHGRAVKPVCAVLSLYTMSAESGC